ncbi:aminoglycoside 6-adenylyltransferase [Virgibacillus pantothenticus]|uniref:aminoglycoside 6-adenylyltransferase n=1 Tax=Virgibacillus pantothenticus TaxID=1473 RepID=UPI001C21D537|nr:aminoglycoside 6-adenylyltransferase [Virgibacillus pantothenticus]MBU8567214.1 aminoglycoside 6-adenylyltransferase [Virgibacillus pantothenticus]MBU8599971.1 aminoglycoside 6-adenylyltransferase [Virgibacillus pantothenticus]MBU8635448.1 aminoglycoside 6-adenylyltransferase [Virgibacillus pantothenticus]MBU8642265.1 aminoglycoside 6-adenylyltransferase [Virgibacillus pantothenticus]MBU8646296.1 aminoglycoside 6-adenylyltransferase [Virgibacillus pantothenticus]
MRTEQEMMQLIMQTAQQDERIRAVVLNGSRANPNVEKDMFQDFDIVYVVKNMASFTSDHTWVDIFGDRIMMQMPEEKVTPPPENKGHFVYLMQFIDGNRLDLTLIPEEKLALFQPFNSLSMLLMDKDQLIGNLPPTSEKDYYIQRPSEQEFADVCNEFWWICLNIGKGLWRKEITYTMFMYEQINRNVLMQMIDWHIGVKTNFSASSGKLGKYYPTYLDKQDWENYMKTYSGGNDFEQIWQALFTMCQLFTRLSKHVAHTLDFAFPHEDITNVTMYLRRIRELSNHA